MTLDYCRCRATLCPWSTVTVGQLYALGLLSLCALELVSLVVNFMTLGYCHSRSTLCPGATVTVGQLCALGLLSL